MILLDQVHAQRAGAGTHGALGHVVAVELHSVDVSHDAVLVVEMRLIRRHVERADKLLVIILCVHNRFSRSAESNEFPVTVVNSDQCPSRRDIGPGVVSSPFFILVDGVVEGKSIILFPLGRHMAFEYYIAIQTGCTQPGRRTPIVSRSINKAKRVLTVRRCGKAILVDALFVIGKGSACGQNKRSRKNLVGFSVSRRTTLLFNGYVHQIRGTRQKTYNSTDYRSFAMSQCLQQNRMM